MKLVKLKLPAEVAGLLRTPDEGVLQVDDAEAARLEEAGVLDGDPEDPEPDDKSSRAKK